MEKQLTVCIQIPTYNQANCIQRAINSALCQDYSFLKVVVNDDCSNDSTISSIHKNGIENLFVYRNDLNMGRVANYRKMLLEYSTSDWVVNLDGDDYYVSKDFISNGISQIKLFSDAVLYLANVKKINSVLKFCKSAKRINSNHIIVDGIDFLFNYNKYRGFRHFSALYKRQTAIDAGFYSENSLNADFVSIMKLAAYGKFIISSNVVGNWEFNSQSSSRKFADEKEHLRNLNALNTLVDFLSSKFDDLDSAKLKDEMFELQKYYLSQFMVLYSEFNISLRIIIFSFKFSKDYLKLLISFIYKRILNLS